VAGLGGEAWTDTGLVFPDEAESGLHPDCVSDAWERVVKRSGVPAIRVHDLHDTWATLALRAGVSPKVVSGTLGHASVAFTLNTYSHLSPGWGAEATSAVAESIFGKEATS
jgi:integrase